MARIRIYGTNGNDFALFAPNPLVDTYEIFGGGGKDTLGGGAGGDLLHGGEGFDFASYQQATGSVRVNMLNMASNLGWAAGDVFMSIEGLIGSRYNDWLTGDNNDNIIDGYAGSDTINGAGGDDEVRDAGGNDNLQGGTDNFDPSGSAPTSFGRWRRARICRQGRRQVRDHRRPAERVRDRAQLRHAGPDLRFRRNSRHGERRYALWPRGFRRGAVGRRRLRRHLWPRRQRLHHRRERG